MSKATDISSEIGTIISFAPKSEYDKKIELIATADDLTTKEKIAAINKVEIKYSQDLSDNAETYSRLLWTKVGAVLGVTAGIVLMVSSPNGRKVAKNIIKKIAQLFNALEYLEHILDFYHFQLPESQNSM